MQFIFKFLNFIWRSNHFWLNNQTFCSKLFFQDLCKFLRSHAVFSDFFASTLLALLREKILLFADMTNPNFLATRQKMIIHRNWTTITLRNMTTFMANYPCMIAFFVDKDSDFFVFSKVFSHPLFKKFRKSLVEFFGHIYQIIFFSCYNQKVCSSGAECCIWEMALLSSFRGACYLPASISNTSYFSSNVSKLTWYMTGTRFSEMSIASSFPHFLFVFLMVLYLQNLPW